MQARHFWLSKRLILSARIPIKTSKWAYRSHRIGVFAIPILIIGIVGSHFDFFAELETFAILGTGFLLSFVAIVFAVMAMSDIWSNGDRGFARAFGGLFFGFFGFSPAVILGIAVLIYPQVTDMSSDIIEPPILSVQNPGDAERIARAAMGRVIDEELFALPIALPIDEVYTAIRPIIDERKWSIVREVPPGNGRLIAEIEVVTRTPILRLKDRATIRLTHFQQGTLVDMRSATLRGRHDFGANSQRINMFFDQLIAVLDTEQPDQNAEENQGTN